jgi:hypothetical protein
MIATLADGTELTLPTLHFGVMGLPSSGKSHLIASMEKPLLVLSSDPFDKQQPYLDRGDADPQVYTGQFGQPTRIVKSATTGNAIIQIEGYYDTDPDNPTAMSALLARGEQLRSEVIAGRWKSIALDSWTNIEWIARQRRSAKPFLVTDAHGKRYGAAKDDLQTFFNARFVHLPCHVGVALHTTEKRDDDGVVTYRGIKAIGELKTDLPGSLGERYLAVNVDGTQRRLDTRNVAYNCCTLIDAPNPCVNEFTALYSNWLKRETEKRAASTAAQPTAGGR